jgi:hypothetical protein
MSFIFTFKEKKSNKKSDDIDSIKKRSRLSKDYESNDPFYHTLPTIEMLKRFELDKELKKIKPSTPPKRFLLTSKQCWKKNLNHENIEKKKNEIMMLKAKRLEKKKKEEYLLEVMRDDEEKRMKAVDKKKLDSCISEKKLKKEEKRKKLEIIIKMRSVEEEEEYHEMEVMNKIWYQHLKNIVFNKNSERETSGMMFSEWKKNKREREIQEEEFEGCQMEEVRNRLNIVWNRLSNNRKKDEIRMNKQEEKQRSDEKERFEENMENEKICLAYENIQNKVSNSHLTIFGPSVLFSVEMKEKVRICEDLEGEINKKRMGRFKELCEEEEKSWKKKRRLEIHQMRNIEITQLRLEKEKTNEEWERGRMNSFGNSLCELRRTSEKQERVMRKKMRKEEEAMRRRVQRVRDEDDENARMELCYLLQMEKDKEKKKEEGREREEEKRKEEK